MFISLDASCKHASNLPSSLEGAFSCRCVHLGVGLACRALYVHLVRERGQGSGVAEMSVEPRCLGSLPSLSFPIAQAGSNESLCHLGLSTLLLWPTTCPAGSRDCAWVWSHTGVRVPFWISQRLAQHGQGETTGSASSSPRGKQSGRQDQAVSPPPLAAPGFGVCPWDRSERCWPRPFPDRYHLGPKGVGLTP